MSHASNKMILPNVRVDIEASAAYVTFAVGDVAKTCELCESALIGDYDADGCLLGLELIAPVSKRDWLAAASPAYRAAAAELLRLGSLGRLVHDEVAA
jgi:uncharacterized protein YuzE